MIVFGTGDKSVIGEITSDTLNKILFNKDTRGQQLKDGDEVLYYHHRLEYGKEGNYFGIMFEKGYDKTAAIEKLKVAGFDVEVDGQSVKIKLGEVPIKDLENYLNALENPVKKIVFGTGDKSVIGEITSDTLNKILFNKDTRGQQLKDGDEVLYYHHRLEYGKEENYFGIMFQKEYDQKAAIEKLKVAGFDVEVDGQSVKIKLGEVPIKDLENYLSALEAKNLDKKVEGQGKGHADKILEERAAKKAASSSRNI